MAAKRPEKGLIYHSDQGSQCCSHRSLTLLRQFGMRVSMIRKGNCRDNEPMASRWRSLKAEYVHHRRFATRERSKSEVMEYIEVFLNPIQKKE